MHRATWAGTRRVKDEEKVSAPATAPTCDVDVGGVAVQPPAGASGAYSMSTAALLAAAGGNESSDWESSDEDVVEAAPAADQDRRAALAAFMHIFYIAGANVCEI